MTSLSAPDVARALINDLADRSRRRETAAALAREFSADDLVVFIRDLELGSLRPAPGFPQTFPAGPRWRRLLADCREAGVHHGEVPFPDRDTPAAALAWTADDGAVFVLLGGAPRMTEDDFARLPFRLLGALLRAESAEFDAAALATVSRDTTRHATALTAALDAARAEAQSKAAQLEAALSHSAGLNQQLHDLNTTLERQVEERVSQLAASQARLRAFFDNSPDWLTLQRTTRDGRFIYEDINPSCEAAYGVRRGDVIGKSLEDVLGNEAAQLPLRHLRELVRTGQPQRYLAKRSMAGQTYTIDVMFALVPGETDGEKFIITTARDITEREQLQGQLRQAQKMEAVGQLTSGVAHDFNNLLTSVLGNLELAETRAGDPGVKRFIQNAARSAERGARLNEQLLAFSRKQHLVPACVDLNRSIQNMSDMLERTIGVTVEIRTSLAPELWPALVDPNQIELVILNLAINGRDAMPDGGALTIATRNVPAATLEPSLALAAGDYVVVSVADTGAGMSEEVVERAFEPFFTTKRVGEGTGLGLSQVYGVARQSNGTVRIRSTLGAGTTMEVYVPRAQAALAPLPMKRPGAAEPVSDRALILVVDDQAEVREVIAAHLQALGYRTIEAANGQIALEQLSQTAEISLLLVDFAMPGQSGIEVIRAAREMRPTLPVVLLTGYADTRAIETSIDGRFVLHKPFRKSELAARVELALQGADTTPAPGRNRPPVTSGAF